MVLGKRYSLMGALTLDNSSSGCFTAKENSNRLVTNRSMREHGNRIRCVVKEPKGATTAPLKSRAFSMA
jgi:hypothetical protein